MAQNDLVVRLRAENKQLKSVLAQSTNELSKFKKEAGKLSNIDFGKGGLSSLVSGMGIGKLTGLATGVGALAAVGETLGKSTKLMIEFEDSMSNLSAITGVSGSALEKFDRQIKKTGTETRTTFKTIADSYTLIGSKMPELLRSSKALDNMTRAVITLKKASRMSLSDATQSLTSIMNQMGANANEASKYINVLAAGSKNGAGDISYLAEAYEKCGTTIKSANLSIEEGTALIEILAKKIPEASTAGNNLRNILLKMMNGADQFNPKVVGLTTALENLRKKTNDTVFMTKMFGAENVNAAITLANAADEAERLKVAITGTAEAEAQANIQTNNVAGSLERLSTNWNNFITNLNNSKGILKNIIDFINDAIEGAGLLLSDKNQLATNRRIQTLQNTGRTSEEIKELAKKEEKEAFKGLTEAYGKLFESKQLRSIMDKMDKVWKRNGNKGVLPMDESAAAILNEVGGGRGVFKSLVDGIEIIPGLDRIIGQGYYASKIREEIDVLKGKSGKVGRNKEILDTLAEALNNYNEALEFVEATKELTDEIINTTPDNNPLTSPTTPIITPPTSQKAPKGSIKALKDEISDLESKIEIEPSNEEASELFKLLKEKQFELDLKTKVIQGDEIGDIGESAPFDWLEEEKAISYANRQQRLMNENIEVQNNKLEEALDILDRMQEEYEENLKRMQELKSSRFDVAVSGLETLSDLGHSIESVVNSFKSAENGFEYFLAGLDAIIATLRTVQAVISSVNAITEVFGATTKATAAADTAATATEIANAQAKTSASAGEAIAGATASGAKLPFPANIAAIAVAVAAVVSALTMITKFANGGIVGGSSLHGDRMLARVNSGEMILNGTQQRKLFSILNGDGMLRGSSIGGEVEFKVSGAALKGVLRNYDSKIR